MKRYKRYFRTARGYTVVELMMGIAVFAIGATGIFAMEIIAAHANGHAKDVALATQLARSWQDKLAIDALRWGGKSQFLISDTRWINEVNTTTNWFLPVNDLNTDPTFGPAADGRGKFVDFTASTDLLYCTHIRLTPLFTMPGAQLLRSEVRVFWPKGETAWANGAAYCDNTANVAAIGAATDAFHFVYHTSVIRETPSF